MAGERQTERCVYCDRPMVPRRDGLCAHSTCIDRYGHGPPEDFMRGEDGYARHMAWEAGFDGR